MLRRLALLLAAFTALAQLPPSGALSGRDRPLVEAEINRIEGELKSSPDKTAVSYEMARTWAAAQQWPLATDWLRKVAAFNAGIDPSRDSIFAPLRATQEFASILSEVSKSTPPVSHSRVAFKIAEGDLVPESIAWDPRGRHFYLGSMRKGEVLRCAGSGDCSPFARGLGVILGPKVRGAELWLLNNEANESSLMRYDLASGRLIRKFPVTGPGRNFNDLAFAPSGDVFLTDTRAAAVWHLANHAEVLEKLPQRFPSANGIALSPDGQFLYVSTFPNGITVLDRRTGKTAPIPRPNGLCLVTIDGLYFHSGTLIAVQNGFMSPRIIRLSLSPDLRRILRFEILERRNPLFDGVTTGVIANGVFFYMANIQDEKKSGFDPIAILKIGL
jgi:WD40 repeat protein